MNIDYYITYDLPVPYKNIEIYPVTVKDYMMFNYYAQCFQLEKNVIPNAKIISMSNLEYLYYKTQEDMEKTPYLIWFDRALALTLQKEKSFETIEKSISRYELDERGKPFFTINKEVYKPKDYEEIKSIICTQNLVELPDENISKKIRDSLENARKYKNKIQGTKPAPLEDYIISLSTVTGWTLEYIYSMSVRKFIKSIRRVDNYIHYKIYLSASMSGMVEFKDKSFIKHWLADIEETDKYKDVSVDLQEIQNKVSLESAKSG